MPLNPKGSLDIHEQLNQVGFTLGQMVMGFPNLVRKGEMGKGSAERAIVAMRSAQQTLHVAREIYEYMQINNDPEPLARLIEKLFDSCSGEFDTKRN